MQDPNVTYHAKKTLDSVLCGKSILGLLTNAEGYKVNCDACLKAKENSYA